ncbi:hypothetical protein [Longispora urticae]
MPLTVVVTAALTGAAVLMPVLAEVCSDATTYRAQPSPDGFVEDGPAGFGAMLVLLLVVALAGLVSVPLLLRGHAAGHVLATGSNGFLALCCGMVGGVSGLRPAMTVFALVTEGLAVAGLIGLFLPPTFRYAFLGRRPSAPEPTPERAPNPSASAAGPDPTVIR